MLPALAMLGGMGGGGGGMQFSSNPKSEATGGYSDAASSAETGDFNPTFYGGGPSVESANSTNQMILMVGIAVLVVLLLRK